MTALREGYVKPRVHTAAPTAMPPACNELPLFCPLDNPIVGERCLYLVAEDSGHGRTVALFLPRTS
jgi:hypothetical protein